VLIGRTVRLIDGTVRLIDGTVRLIGRIWLTGFVAGS
jgi:hypothetical protein